MIKRQGLVERKKGLFKMLAFPEYGGLLSQRPPSPFLDRSEGFIGTQEEQRKRGVNPETHPGEHLGSGLL